MSERVPRGDGAEAATGPGGGVYEWYRRGLELLDDRNPAAAATLLARAADAEPDSRSIREALARAQYDAHRYGEAVASFAALIAADPTDDYAHFGLGLAAGRAGDLGVAAEHLALAAAMRPDRPHYARALRDVRARQTREST
ncbi:tetratricopeptide repeat protein [Blastococcus xanthinilyticus]|uniref:Tetratricopeptide repeat protein n=1 Tax=Blastococcus xanthinilyticus TaxID=1564164 RepID=A0A5S5CQM1_9ACTN|nr:tetratricopeptide repeat protein [Blastococcus xanthinilyticus]TYP81986.1 tetratricopeptide repeat protein [Blastococcus xanthinilyticus]